MNIEEVIVELEKIKAEHGNLRVVSDDDWGLQDVIVKFHVKEYVTGGAECLAWVMTT